MNDDEPDENVNADRDDIVDVVGEQNGAVR